MIFPPVIQNSFAYRLLEALYDAFIIQIHGNSHVDQLKTCIPGGN